MSLEMMVKDVKQQPNEELLNNEDLYDLESKDDLTIVIGLGGARGSGKSLMLAWQALYDMCVLNRTVWSNMKIHTGEAFLRQGYPYKETRELDINLFYMLDEGMADGTIILDEIQNLSDARSSLTIKNRLLNGMLYQIRKRQLRLFYSIKALGWRDKRLGFETDVWCGCLNVSKTPWGKERNIKGGREIFLSLWDESGVVTGRPSDPYRDPPYKEIHFDAGHYVYDCYNSWETQSLEAANTNVKLDLKTKVITNKTQSDDPEEAIVSVINDLLQRGVKEIPRNTFRDVVISLGIDANEKTIGSAMRVLGIKSRQLSDGSRVYVLPELGGENW